MEEIIQLHQYLQGRDKSYPAYYNSQIELNAVRFLAVLNPFLSEIGILSPSITSGWRPKPINDLCHGAPNSYHLRGRAVDLLDDAEGSLDLKIRKRPDLLKKYGLWLEDPLHTPRWVHLDNGDRQDRDSRVFSL
jgi:hypothetical protein